MEAMMPIVQDVATEAADWLHSGHVRAGSEQRTERLLELQHWTAGT